MVDLSETWSFESGCEPKIVSSFVLASVADSLDLWFRFLTTSRRRLWMSSWHFVCVAWVLIALVSSGCSEETDPRPKRVPVAGTITYQGAPLSDAAVAFIPASSGGSPAQGTTNSEGMYRLTTFTENDGAIPGTYGVAVSAVIENNRNPDGTQIYSEEDPRWKPPKSRIPQRYNIPSKSKLTGEVISDEPNVIDFDLEDK